MAIPGYYGITTNTGTGALTLSAPADTNRPLPPDGTHWYHIMRYPTIGNRESTLWEEGKGVFAGGVLTRTAANVTLAIVPGGNPVEQSGVLANLPAGDVYVVALVEPRLRGQIGGRITINADGEIIFDDTGLGEGSTPGAHAASHATGGSDAITPASIGAEAAGVAAALVDDLSGVSNTAVALTNLGFSGTTGTIPVKTAGGYGNSPVVVSGSNVGFGIAPTRAVTVNGAISLTDGGTFSFPAGFTTSLNGALMDFGVNEGVGNRFGTYNPAYQGGLFRLDSRSGQPVFSVMVRPAGQSSDVTGVLGVTSGGYVMLGNGSMPGSPLQMASGAYCSAGGAWTNASSEELKTAWSDISDEEIKAAIDGFSVRRYEYIDEPGVTRVGDSAQSAHRLTGAGDSTSTAPSDVAYIAIAMCQYLYKRLSAVEAKIKEMENAS